MYAAPRTMPETAQAAQRQFTSNAPCKIVNSPINPFSSGRPMLESMTIMKSVA